MAYLNSPDFILMSKDLNPSEKLIYSYFHTHYVAGNIIFVSNGFLAEMLNCTTRQIQYILEQLTKKGYILRTEQIINGELTRIIKPIKFGHGTLYHQESETVEANESAKSYPQVETTHEVNFTPPMKSASPPPRNKLHTNININNNNNKKTGTGTGAVSFANNDNKLQETYTLIRSKFNDPRLSMKQVKEIVDLHDKSVAVSWSIENYLHDIANEPEPIIKKTPVFISRLKKLIETENRAYFPDNRVYTTEKTRDFCQEKRDSEILEATLCNDPSKLKTRVTDDLRGNLPSAIIMKYFNGWRKNAATQSELDRFHGKDKKLYDYFESSILPHCVVEIMQIEGLA